MRTSKTASILLTGLVCLALTACGFSPMYGNDSAARNLSEIMVVTGDERIDFFLQEALIDEMGARQATGPYRLVTQTQSGRLALGIGADAIAQRFAVGLRVDYSLYYGQSTEPELSGRVSVEASYNVARQVFSSVQAQEDAETRAAQLAAERIAMELARASLSGELPAQR